MAAQQTTAHRADYRHLSLRSLQLWLIPAMMLVAIVAPLLALGAQLPDPLAARWGQGARPNAHLAHSTLVATLAGTWLLAWGLFCSANGSPRAEDTGACRSPPWCMAQEGSCSGSPSR